MLFIVLVHRHTLFLRLDFLADVFHFSVHRKETRSRLTARTARHRAVGRENVAVERNYLEREAVALRYRLTVFEIVYDQGIAEKERYDFIVIIVEFDEFAGKPQRAAIAERSADFRAFAARLYGCYRKESRSAEFVSLHKVHKRLSVVGGGGYDILRRSAERGFYREFVFRFGVDSVCDNAFAAFAEFGILLARLH